jgi:hypothetical protein
MSTLPNIFPTAKADLFPENAAGALPEKNSSGGGHFADWMSRALSPKSAAQSSTTGEVSEGDTSVSATSHNSLSASASLTPLVSSPPLGERVRVRGQQPNSDVDINLQTDASSPRPSSPAGAREKIIAQGTNIIGNSAVAHKKSKTDVKVSAAGHAKPAENLSAADPSALPENISVVSPEILPVPNITLALTLTEGALNLPADNGTVFQSSPPVAKSNSGAPGKTTAIIPQSPAPATALNVNTSAAATIADKVPAAAVLAETAAVFPEMKNVPAAAAKIPEADFSPDQLATGYGSKIQPDSRKKAAPADSAAPMVKTAATTSSNTVDSKTVAVTPAATPISPATPEINLKATKTDTARTTDFSSPEFSGLSSPDGKSTAPVASPTDGTSAANQEGLMGGGEKTGKIAALAGKFLPGAAAVTSRGTDLSVRTESAFTTATAGATDQSGSATVAVSVSALENPLAEDIRAQALERAHDAMTLHAMSLNNAGTDSLQVVIKPGAGTELSLELRQRGGSVEVQAVLQQGDFKHLNQQWPELQQRLEQRGIKLASLTADGTFTDAGSDGRFQQRKDQSENPSAGALSGMTFTAPLTGTFARPAARTAAAAGWETWA